MRVWIKRPFYDHEGKAVLKRGAVEVARSETYRTVVLRLDRVDGTVFLLKEDSVSFVEMISLVEVKVGPDASGQLFLVDVRPYRRLNQVWYGQVSWLLEALGVAVDAQEFSDDDASWDLVNQLEYRTKPIPMRFTLPDDELSVYSSLGEPLPYLWPIEQLLAWAVERPDAVVLREG